MAEFMEVLESIQSFDVRKPFEGDGVGVRGAAKPRNYQVRLAEAAKFMAEIMKGKRPVYQLREVMSTSDFPLLFGDIIDRQLLANYNEWPSTWQAYCKRGTVPDFREVNRFAINGAETVLTLVPELTQYPAAGMTDARYHYHVGKYGRRLPFSWETLVNDDLGAFNDVPQRLGRAARRSEDRFATALHWDANGPAAAVYTNGNLNRIAIAAGGLSNNPALSILGLQHGMFQLAQMVDTGGDPIVVDAVVLEVPPALEITARNILNATQIWLNPNLAAGTAEQQMVTENWMRNKTTLVVNPYIPLVNTTSPNTSWALHAAPSNGRPAFEVGFLRGHESPEIFMKTANSTRVGGGQLNPTDGDFETDSVEYKVRHIFGGVVEEVKATVASTGAGGA